MDHLAALPFLYFDGREKLKKKRKIGKSLRGRDKGCVLKLM
jgi:hypothetical protein